MITSRQNRESRVLQAIAQLRYRFKLNRLDTGHFGGLDILQPIIYEQYFFWSHGDTPKAFLKDSRVRFNQSHIAREDGILHSPLA